MKLGSSALKVKSAGISVRSLYTVIPGGRYRKPQAVQPLTVDLSEADEGEGGYGWYLYASPDEHMALTTTAPALKLVQA